MTTHEDYRISDHEFIHIERHGDGSMVCMHCVERELLISVRSRRELSSDDVRRLEQAYRREA